MTDKRSQIAFEELGLGSILKRYRLRVPPNQREYAWTTIEVSQLLQDFSKALSEDGPYFLGTIVTIPREEGVLEVVDGQQRLATTALLLGSIRDYLRTKNEVLIVQSIDDEFLSVIDRAARTRVPRLTLNIDDNELFTKVVAGGGVPSGFVPTHDSHQRLLDACDEATRHIQAVAAPFQERDQADQLNRWLSFLEHRALVVLLKVPDDANAYRMFETLNDRGLRTSQADLIKNYLFSRAGGRIAEVQHRWSLMRGALESASEDPDITIDFLRHALILRRGHLREIDVYDAVKSIVNSEPSAASFGSELEVQANKYVAMSNPDHVDWNAYPDSTRRSIEVFNLFGIKPMRPVMLAVAARLNPAQTAAAYQFLVSLGVRLAIASGTRSSSVEVPLAEAAKKVYGGEVTTARGLATELNGLTPSDADFQAAVATTRVSNARLARYYLRSLEMAENGEASPWFIPQNDKAVINLEHVLPRHPEGNWPDFTDDAVARLTNRLGNLALLRAEDNSQLKSDAFSDKKAVYASCPYKLTALISTYSAWDETTIADRQAKLAALAVKAWPRGVFAHRT